MKKTLIALTIVGNLFLCSNFVYAAQQALDQMVATVNDDLITRSELDRELKAVKMQMTQTSANLPASDAELKKMVLNQLINKKLQLQLAEQAGITLSDQEVEQALKTIAAKNNVSLDELLVHVKQEGMSPDVYRTEIHDQIVMQKLQQHEVAGKVNVTPEEVTAFMKSAEGHAAAPAGDSEYRVEDILIPTSDNPSATEISAAKARAASVVQQLQKGANFSKLAKEDGPDLQDNDLGYLKVNDLPSAFAEKVPGMKKNEVSDPIQTGNGLHVLRMTDVRNSNAAANPMSDRKMVEAMLLQKKFEQAVNTWVNKLRSTAFITEA